MPKAALVKRGEEYLSGIQLSELEEAYRREPPGKSRDRLQAAGLRKRGRTLGMIARIMGRSISTVHRWLSKMEREGLKGRHDRWGPGRMRFVTKLLHYAGSPVLSGGRANPDHAAAVMAKTIARRCDSARGGTLR